MLILACAITAGLVFFRFGPDPRFFCGSLFAWALILLAAIDLKRHTLPDRITLPLVWAGLLVNLQESAFTPLENAVIGAMAGYLSLWSVNQGHRFMTGREGMGYGDFKMLAAIGAWLGWPTVPGVVLAAGISHVLFGLYMIRARGLPPDTPLPFGPSLAFGGCLILSIGMPSAGDHFLY